MTAMLTRRPAPTASGVRMPSARTSGRASAPINLPERDLPEVSLRYVPKTSTRPTAGIEFTRPGRRTVILYAGELGMAAHHSGLPITELMSPAEALRAVLAGVDAVGPDRIATDTQRSQAIHQALIPGTANTATKRAVRELWGSLRRPSLCANVQWTLFGMVRPA